MKNDQINGFISGSKSQVNLKSIILELGADDAWALCNLLSKDHVEKNCFVR